MRALVCVGLVACTEGSFGVPHKDDEDTVEDTVVADTEAPVAICTAFPAEAAPLTPVQFRGENSYDPQGNPLVSYRWTLAVAPDGSTADFPADGANRDGFIPDVVGEYVATLIVTDDHGNPSQVCATTLRVTAPPGLWVELTWQFGGDDLDLHLAIDDGTADPEDDCYAGACDVDWGLPGDPADDPVSVRDDVNGVGPELIQLPAPSAGMYVLFAHDNLAAGTLLTANNEAAMRVFRDGDLLWEGTRTVGGEEADVGFISLSLPSEIVTEL